MTDTNETIIAPANSTAKRPRKMAREPKANVAVATVSAEAPSALPKRENKTDLVLGLLNRPEGATIDQLVVATGWLPHTTRAALTGLKKKGHVVTSEKTDGVRHYRVGAGAA